MHRDTKLIKIEVYNNNNNNDEKDSFKKAPLRWEKRKEENK